MHHAPDVPHVDRLGGEKRVTQQQGAHETKTEMTQGFGDLPPQNGEQKPTAPSHARTAAEEGLVESFKVYATRFVPPFDITNFDRWRVEEAARTLDFAIVATDSC